MADDERADSVLPLSRVASGRNESGVRGDSAPVSSGVEPSLPTSSGITPALWPALLEVLPAAVLVVDGNLRIVVANDAARCLFDSPGSCLVGYAVSRFLHADKLQAAQQLLSSRPGSHTYRDTVSVGGIDIDISISVNLASSAGREVLVLTLQDRTAERRERAEWAACTPAIALQGSELPVARLRQAQHFEVLGHLTGTLAHDFGNLLSVILASLESAKRRVVRGEDPSGELDRAMIAAERSVQTTAEVLRYSRKRELPLRGIDPTEVLIELRGLLERALDGASKLRLNVEACPLIAVEPGRLETALLNLIVNARDALGPGGRVCIDCRPRQLAEEEAAKHGLLPGSYVAIAVSDDGAGMTSDVAARAFEPFFTTKPEGLGTGLGLSTVRAFVQRAGGAVSLSSEVGQGTTVELLLPPGCG